jgi:hypothetical protein
MPLPIFFENSRIPRILSRVSPIDIGAISLGIAVFARATLDEDTRRHETIHYRQWRELGFVLFPLLYGFFYARNRLWGMSGEEAYFEIPFEREAYVHESDEGYLARRPFWAWINFAY